MKAGVQKGKKVINIIRKKERKNRKKEGRKEERKKAKEVIQYRKKERNKQTK